MNAVIFDMDGVLIDSEPLHFQADEAMLKKLNIEAPAGYLEKFVGVTDSVMWKEILETYNIDADVKDVLNAQLSIKLKLLKKGVFEPIDGVIDLLNELEQMEIKCAVASSSAGIFIKEVIKKLSLESYFQHWVSGESVSKSKPSPEIFLKVAEMIGEDPGDCVVIEDSANGVSAAKHAGMKCIGFKNASSGTQDLSKADLVVRSIRDITPDILMKL